MLSTQLRNQIVWVLWLNNISSSQYRGNKFAKIIIKELYVRWGQDYKKLLFYTVYKSQSSILEVGMVKDSTTPWIVAVQRRSRTLRAGRHLPSSLSVGWTQHKAWGQERPIDVKPTGQPPEQGRELLEGQRKIYYTAIDL